VALFGRALPQNAVRYLAELPEKGMSRPRLESVQRALDTRGVWEEHTEWRISTVTTSRVEIVTENDRIAYRVTVSCDASTSAVCPTLERTLYFVAVFERLHADLFWTLGWPSWVSRDQMEA
jgi:hypothetical protein